MLLHFLSDSKLSASKDEFDFFEGIKRYWNLAESREAIGIVLPLVKN